MKATIAIVLSVLVIVWLAVGYIHTRGHVRIIEQYLEQNRPDVASAIEAYRLENGSYPFFITNAVPRYYRGKQERLYFLEFYHYKNLGTNYYLKHFSSNESMEPNSRHPFPLAAGCEFELPFSASALLPAAVAHVDRWRN